MKNTPLLCLFLGGAFLLLIASHAVAETLEATTAFNEANAQNNEIFQRLWALSLAKDSESASEQVGPVASEGKSSNNSILRQNIKSRWSTFVDGNGIFSQVGIGNSRVLNINGGGVTVGATYDWNKRISTGFYAGYEGASLFQSGSSTSDPTFQSSNKSSFLDNAFRYGLFGTFKQGEGSGLYGMGLIGGTYHQYNTSYNSSYKDSFSSSDPTLSSTSTGSGSYSANSSYGAGELDSMLAGGYDFKVGGVTFGPTASLQYTYFQGNNQTENISGSYQYTLNDSFGSYSSANSYSDKARLSQYNTSSMLSGLGAHAAYTWTPSKRLLVIPQISLNWQHEFLQNRFSQTLSFNDGSSFKYSVGREPILDTLYTGVGVTLEYAKRYNASFFYNTSAGNKYLVSQNIFLSAGIIF